MSDVVEFITLEIRQLQALDEFSTAVRLQQEIWGFEDIELLPRRLFVVASKIGGQLLGAFDRGKMIAFCLCIPGLKPGGKAYLHSHMMGVLPEYRNSGIGRQLKLKQREFALDAQVDLIEWTFDPLEIKNAFFNIERLGAVIRRYVYNQYGTTSSHLHGGLPTDRLVPEWWIRSRQVEQVLAGEPLSREQVPLRRIEVPIDIASIRERDTVAARAVQERIGQQFAECFQSGLAVTGFERNKDAGVYLLSEWQSE
jgi:predicted GNAT superfamily acetyltransferase